MGGFDDGGVACRVQSRPHRSWREGFSVKASGPLAIIRTAATVLAVAILACSVPARRASRFHPMAALWVE